MNRRGPVPGSNARGRDPRATVEANAEALSRYVASIDVPTPVDLPARVLDRLAREPRRTPPGRLVAALASLSPARVRRAFARNLDAAAGRLRVAPVVRAQALALVAVLVVSVGALGTAGAVVLRSVLERGPAYPTDFVPAVGASAAPSPTPSALPSASAVPSASPPTSPISAPRSTPTDLPLAPPASVVPVQPDGRASAPPGVTPRSVPTPRPHPTPRADKTQKPHPTPKVDKTRKPRPTPRADTTRKPRPTPRADRTPRPGTGQAIRTPAGDGTPR
jgi:hypothetical protein